MIEAQADACAILCVCIKKLAVIATDYITNKKNIKTQKNDN